MLLFPVRPCLLLIILTYFYVLLPKPFFFLRKKPPGIPGGFLSQQFFRSKKGALQERLSFSFMYPDQISSRFLMIFPSTPSKTCISSSDTPL